MTYKQKCYYTNYAKKYYENGTFYNINKAKPIQVTIKPTLCCIANCLHCNPRNKKFDGKRKLTLKEYEILFEELYEMGTRNICISGGEPLLYKNIIQLVNLATRKGLKVSLNTNDFLLSQNILDELLNAGLMALNVSIDSPFSERHDNLRGLNGMFDKVISNLKQYKSNAVPFVLNIRMVLSKYNYKDIDKMIDLALNLNADLLSIDMIEADSKNKYFLLNKNEILEFRNKIIPKLIQKIETLNISDNLKKYNIKEIKDIFNIDFNKIENYVNGIYWPNDRIKEKCDIPNSFMIIEGDGNVLPCNAVEYNREKIVGNIFDNPIQQLWESDKWEKFRKEKMNFCKECPMNMSFMLLFNEKEIERDYNES